MWRSVSKNPSLFWYVRVEGIDRTVDVYNKQLEAGTDMPLADKTLYESYGRNTRECGISVSKIYPADL